MWKLALMGRRTHHRQGKRYTNFVFLVNNMIPKQRFILSVPWPHTLLLLYLTDIILSTLRKYCKSLFLTLVTPSLVLGEPALRLCLKHSPLSSFWKLEFRFNTNSQSFLKPSYLSTHIQLGKSKLWRKSIKYPMSSRFLAPVKENWNKKVYLRVFL